MRTVPKVLANTTKDMIVFKSEEPAMKKFSLGKRAMLSLAFILFLFQVYLASGAGEPKIKFEARGYGGQVRKLIYVDSNDPGETHRQLEVAADIEIPPSPRIDLDPFNFDAGLVVEGEEVKANLKIMNKGALET